MSAIAILIATGIGLAFFTVPWGWIVAPIPLGTGIGAIFPRPIRSALIGAALGTIAAFFIFQWLATMFGGG
jgi:hypothetical protein